MEETFTADVTARFQEALPYALLPISPALAALHTTRVHLQSSKSPYNRSVCAKCGSHLFAGKCNSEVRTFRLRKPKGSKAQIIRRTCRICDSSDTTALEKVDTASFPARNTPIPHPFTDMISSARNSHEAISILQPEVLASPLPRFSLDRSCLSTSTGNSARLSPLFMQRPSVLPSDSRDASIHGQPKSRPKKKSGLQDLLARNREKEEKERLRKAHGQVGGLTDFLSGL